MFNLLKTRFKQGTLTYPYPSKKPVLPDRFRGKPILDRSKCPEGCRMCVEACPIDAISFDEKKGGLCIDLGRCLFCTQCEGVCPQKAIHFTQEHALATRDRSHLLLGEHQLARPLEKKMLKLFRRSLKLRVVSAGDCNGCSVDVNVLNTLVFDLQKFGIQVVASPRHADGLVVTGPVSENMRVALLKTYEAIPAPKIVIAVGSCAISGGPFRDHPEVHNGAGNVIPVDLYVPGCPPNPWTILDGFLRLIGRI